VTRRREAGLIVSVWMVFIVLEAVFSVVLNAPEVWANGTIYIRADGSIDPPTAPITTVDNVTYTLTGNITSSGDGIIVERENITIDGNGYTLQGSGSGNGFYWTDINGVVIKNTNIENFSYGVYISNSLYSSFSKNNIKNNERVGIFLDSYNSVLGNNITNNWLGLYSYGSYNSVSGNHITANYGHGILLGEFSFNNSVSGNNITSNREGIGLESSYNSVSGNNITSNEYGISLYYYSPSNFIYHNNFVNNLHQISIFVNQPSDEPVNIWDDGYPSGGNYWSDYTGIDEKSGPYHNYLGSDGIGDTPYTFSESNRDRYPLMNPMGSPQPPIALFTYTPEYTVIDEAVTFNATSSYDRDGFIADYKWDFGDGNVASVIDSAITHIYTVPAAYLVNLTVTDDDGFSHSVAKSVMVKLYRSAITVIVGSTTAPVGSKVTINGTITPSRTGVNVTISYRPSGGMWATLATVVTNSDGNYTYAWKTTYIGTFEIKANWTGDENTWPAESETRTIDVQGWGYTVYVRADGSIDPSTAPIQREGDLYTLTDNIYAPIVVERSNLIIDGDKYTVQGSDTGYGFYLFGINNVTIRNTSIRNFDTGIQLSSSANIAVSENDITDNGGYGVDYRGNFWIYGQGVTLSSSDNVTISRNNITNNGLYGVYLFSSNEVTVSRNNITSNGYRGILIDSSSLNIISENNITNNRYYFSYGYYVWLAGDGVALYSSSNNAISGNNISNNGWQRDYCYGIWLSSSSGNTISGNRITNNGWYGISGTSSSNNRIYHNNFANNIVNALVGEANTWDDGYPSGGNYWSDYTGTDIKSGPNQDQPRSDGIGDTPYNLYIKDRYPLMSPWPSGPGLHELEVTLKAPTRLPPGNSTLLEATVINKGFNKEENVALFLYVSSTVVNSTTISSLEAESSFTVNYLWTPTVEGVANVTAYAVPIPREMFFENNRKTTFVTVSVNPPVQNINTGLYYETIQQAIDAPETLDGHTVKVDVGVYYEHLIIYKSLKIIGEDRTYTIIDGSKTGTFVVQITVNNVVLSGFTIQDSNIAPTPAIALYSSNNVISNNTITNNGWGIYSFSVSNNTIENNIITNNVYGVYLEWSDTHTIKNNTISNHQEAGIYLRESRNNAFANNIIEGNKDGVVLVSDSNYNRFYHNNFIDNTSQGFTVNSDTNTWDNGYPSGGNHWSNYAGVDVKSGPNQNQAGSDGIGDTAHAFDTNNIDRYPLMAPITKFEAGTWDSTSYSVDVVSNSTVSSFSFDQQNKLISFNVTGADGSTGFSRVTIPNALLGGPYLILVNYTPPLDLTETTNGTHTFLYFTYTHSIKQVEIIGTTAVPEFPPSLILPLVITLTLLAVVLAKRIPKHRGRHA